MSTDDRHRDLIARLLGPAGPEVSCEECFDPVAGTDGDSA